MEDSLEKTYGENKVSITKQEDVFNITIKNKNNSFYLYNGEVGILKTLDDYGVQIGDYINYDCYTGVESSKLYYKSLKSQNGSHDQEFEVTESDKTMKWRILGIDAKGSLMITTADTIRTKQGNSYRLYGKEGYRNGPNELNNISNIFGNGRYAQNSRSMKVDDINKITQYVINEPVKYTYTKKEDGKIYRNDLTTSSQTKFEYYDTNPNEEWKQLINTGDTSSEIYNTDYSYIVNTSQKAKKMLVFGEDDETKLTFWLTDRCLNCLDSYVYYRIRNVSSGSLGSQGLWCSNGGPCSVVNKDIRPVIILSSDVILSGSSENGWIIQ